MIKISLRYKVALELYASLSLFFTIIILLYYYISDMIKESLFFPVVGIIGIFLIGFIFFMRTLILDVDSVKFEGDESRDEPNIVEIKLINKVALELISSVSNFIIIVIIFVFGFEKTGGISLEVLSAVFIVVLLIPLMMLFKSLIFDFNLILTNKKHRENFINELVNRKTLFFFIIAAIIIISIIASNKMVASSGKLYQKSISTGEDTMSDLSTRLYITSITGIRNDIHGGPVIGLDIRIESLNLDFNLNYFNVRFFNGTAISNLKYGLTADGSHFSYEGKTTGKDNSRLRKNDVGIITINLTSTNQELHSFDRGTVRIEIGNNRTLSKEFKVPELKGESRILLYSSMS